MTDEVLTSEEDGILIVTINRPDAKNAMTKAAAEAIAAAMDRLDNDDSLRVGILTGAGGTFCSGMDLKGFLRGESPSVEGRGFGGVVQQPPEKPLIAAVEGFALAGGLEVALTCDLIVAAEGVKLGIPEVGVGLLAAGGALLRLPSRVPYAVAMEMALTADPITAEKGAEYGLVSRVTKKGGAVEGAMELADRIARNAPLSVAASKQMIQAVQGRTEAEFWEHQRPVMAAVFSSEDAKEGPKAFAEKRPPSWSGR
ncbi:MAG TPA: enoyl-CoA hydratase [Acidimicrobiaceae bacterium]|nr:enoyl-CoA hydratase [Acidimicrobiaceae bacterium]